METRKRGKNEEAAGVPRDVLLEIFYRLPLKCLARFKSIEKEWNSLISSPGFHEAYRARKLERGDYSDPQVELIFANYHPPRLTQLYTVELHDSLITNPVDQELLSFQLVPLRTPHELMMKNKNDRYKFPPKLLGSYNGLVGMLAVLTCGDSDFILWNPLTKKYITASFYQLSMTIGGGGGCGRCSGCCGHGGSADVMDNSLFGLCYDCSTDAYMAVVANRYVLHQQRRPPNVEAYGEKTDIYLVNFKTGAFRTLPLSALGERPIPRFTGGVGTVVCGVPHWVEKSGNNQGLTTNVQQLKDGILYFDLREKSFKWMAGPTHEKVVLGLGSLDGGRQLSVVLHAAATSACIEVWVMKEYGNLESWTNLFVLPPLTSIARKLAPTVSVLRLMENGEYLVDVGRKVFVGCDPKKGSLRIVKVGYWRGKFSAIIANEPSLVSPPQPRKA